MDKNKYWINKKFGKLTVIEVLSEKRVTKSSKEKVLKVQCECGNTAIKQPLYLIIGETKTCGNCSRILSNTVIGKKFGELVVVSCNDEFVKPGDLVTVKCKCGTIKEVVLSVLMRGRDTTCGNCSKKPKEWWIGRKFGELTVVKFNSEKQLVKVECSCGKNNIYSAKYLYNNRKVGTCGKCNWIDKKDILGKRFGELTAIECSQNLVNYNSEITCLCSCGKKIIINYGKLRDNKGTCRKCTYQKSEEWIGKKFGNFTVLKCKENEFNINGFSPIKVKCGCGRDFITHARQLTLGQNENCGKCNWRSEEWWLNRQFNDLIVISVPKKEFSLFSFEELTCKCKCGNIIKVFANYLYNGYTKNCQCCSSIYKKWYDLTSNNKYRGYRSTTKNLKSYFETHPSIEFIKKNSDIGTFLCKSCNRLFTKSITRMIDDKQVSCGCLGKNANISSLNFKVAAFIKKLGYTPILEYSIEGKRLKIDIFIEETNLAIEINGLYWHTDNTQKTEQRKYEYCIDNSINYLMFFEDEIHDKVQICKNILKVHLGYSTDKVKIRPQKCEIKLIKSELAFPFYDKFHIQGRCNSKYHIGVFYKNQLIACMSIRTPFRPNSGDWEISRMASNFKYQVHGIWSYLLKWVLTNKLIHGKLITFSDNRLFNGNVYEKIGMTKVGKIRSDYYWTKGMSRFNKSSLRKPDDSDKTEFELRSSEGYHRIWDLGKTKWEIYIP